MSVPSNHVRLLRVNEIEKCSELIRGAGLTEPTSLMRTEMSIEPNGFFVVVDDVTDELMAVCGCVSHDPRVVYVGPYATRKDLQGKGVGIKAWRACMEYIGGRNAGLCASPTGAPLYYNKGGFRVVDPYTQLVFSSKRPNVSNLESKAPPNITVVELTRDLDTKVIGYDEVVIKVNRKQLLELTLNEDDSLTLVALDGRNVVGYGSLKMVDQFTTKMGALYADTPAIAEFLTHQLLTKFRSIDATNNGLYWMLIEQNPDSVKLLEKLGCDVVFSMPRYYTKYVPEPAADITRVFSINSPGTGPY